MSISRRPTTLAVCAVVAAAGLAACSKAAPSGSVSSASGAFGSVPPASGTPHAGTVTWAEAPGSAPTWIFPVTPGANLSIYHDRQLPVRDVAAAVLVRRWGQAGGGAVDEHG